MRRRIVTITLLLILGAIVNIAVAWGCMLGNGPLPQSPGVLAQQLHSDFFGYPLWRESIDSEGIGCRWRRHQLPYYEMYSDGFWHAAIGLEAGWPVLSMSGAYRGTYLPSITPMNHADGVLLLRRSGNEYALPVRPIWSGFFINTWLYALHLWLLFFVLGTARRMIRRRRGLCEKCAYPIGVSPVCTECGAAVSPSDSGRAA